MQPNSPADGDALGHAIALLRAHGVDRVSHSEENLLSHLVGTRTLLLSWGARPELAWAGLFHSVFTTESFDATSCPPELRERIGAIFGMEVLSLIERFGAISRASLVCAATGTGVCLDHRSGEALEVDAETITSLLELHAANAVEQLDRLPPICAVMERERLVPCADLLSKPAWAALSAAAQRADQG